MILTYNGITMKLAKLHSFVTQPVMSADGADWICDRVSLDVEAVYNPAATSYAPNKSATPGRLPAQTAAAIHHYLSEPRGTLTYSDESGNTVISSPPAGNSQDVIDGPKPLHVTVTEVVGQKAWRVRFAVETYVMDCPGGGSGSPVLSNRFMQSHVIDRDMLTTVTTQGETWFSMAALENAGQVADQFRNVLIPPEPDGFLRMGLDVRVSSLGNKLNWVVVDRQLLPCQLIGDQLDVLAFKANYVQQTVRAEGGLAPSGRVTHIVNVQVLGKPQAVRANLCVFALRVALAKIPLPNRPNPATDLFLADAAIDESLSENAFGLRIVAQGPATQQGAQGIGGLQTGFFLADGVVYQFRAPFLDPNDEAPSIGEARNTRHPTFMALAFASALQQPCVAPSPVKGPPGAGSPDSSVPTSPTYSIGVSVGDSWSDLTPGSTLWSQSNSDGGVYDEYRIDNVHKTQTGTYAVPTSGPVSSGTQHGYTDPNGNWIPAGNSTSSVEAITIHQPYSTLACDWTAERQGAPPEVPNPQPSDPNLFLISWDVEPAGTGVVTGGTNKVFRVSGRYEYGMKAPINPGEAIPFPVTPNTSIAFGDDALDDWQPGITTGDSGGGSVPVLGGAV